jgi:electron transfer flavoprotein alpha subunit
VDPGRLEGEGPPAGDGSTDTAPGAVWVLVEQHRGTASSASLELFPEAQRLARSLGARVEAVFVGTEDALCSSLGHLGSLGAAVVRLIETVDVDGGDLEPAAECLGRLVLRDRPSLVLCPATRRGRELAAMGAARAGAGLMPDCTRIDVVDGAIRAQRPAYGGRLSATVASPAGEPAFATVAAGALAVKAPVDAGHVTPEVRRTRPDTPARFSVESSWQPGPWETDLGEAEVIVAGGRGVATQDGFAMLTALAQVLGAALGASRPVVDAGVVSYDRQVGLSGRTVRPRLYIACGISGAPHHLQGMRESEAVIAINQDRHAPIFGLADVGIVGDAHQVVPAMTERLRALAGAGRPADAGDLVGALARVAS